MNEPLVQMLGTDRPMNLVGPARILANFWIHIPFKNGAMIVAADYCGEIRFAEMSSARYL
jgi:hypothetical protein